MYHVYSTNLQFVFVRGTSRGGGGGADASHPNIFFLLGQSFFFQSNGALILALITEKI